MSSRTSPCKAALRLAGLAVLAAAPLGALPATDISKIPLPTYTVGSNVDIKPNILMVLDDSGSMDSDFLPDWASSGSRADNYDSLPDYLFRNSSYNGMAYNPAITYLPPVTFNSDGTKNTTAYPSQSGMTTATGADTGSSLPNWKAVKNDAYGVQASGTTNLQAGMQTRRSFDSGSTWTAWSDVSSCTPDSSGSSRRECRSVTRGPYFYTTIPGEYCNSSALTGCTTTTTATGLYQYPAPLRWCDGTSLATCRALQGGGYSYPRMPAPKVATVTLGASGSGNTSVSGITVDSVQIMSAGTATTNDRAVLAQAVVDQINACTLAKPSPTNCGTVGYSAYVTGSNSNIVYILAPGSTTSTPSVSKSSGGLSSSATAFANRAVPLTPWLTGNASSDAPPGSNLLTVLDPGTDSYPYPGSNAKAATRTDCAGTTCTYNEEMQNYANWYTYYRTRMQMMKTSTSRAFSVLDTDANIAAGTTRFRVGYLSINNNTDEDFLNISDFDPAQKVAWFTKLFAAEPSNNTPLRRALSTAGRLYGGRLNGTTLNGSTVVDPLQYSCQRNYTILSTDGYWNSSGGKKLDGSTDIGNEDGLMVRPYSDGASSQNQERTAHLQTRSNTQTAQKGTLQKQLSQVQTRTSNLQSTTRQLQTRSTGLQSRTATVVSSGGQRQKRTSGDSGNTWTEWYDTSSCSADSSGSSRTQCRRVGSWSAWADVPGACTADPTSNSGSTTRECRYRSTGSFANTSSTCSAVAAASGGDINWPVAVECQYTSPGTTVPAASCTNVAASTGPTYSVINPVSCSYSAPTAWSNVGSCAAVAADFTNAVARECQNAVTSAYANATSCSPGGPDGSGVITDCRYSFANAAATQTCAPAEVAGDYTNQFVYKNCGSTNSNSWTNVNSCTATTPNASGVYTECGYGSFGSWVSVTSCTAVSAPAGPNYTVANIKECQVVASGGVYNSLADAAAYYYNNDLRSASNNTTLGSSTADTTGTCVGPIISPATTPNDLCADNVQATGRDTSTKQHMTTNTLGLGVQGRMVYSQYQNDAAGQRTYVPDYWQQPSGDFYAIKNGSTVNTNQGICTWQNSGTCTWPAPSSDSIANIDDLWHAAVNGRGTYFSATDPASLASALQSVLSQIVNTPRPGTGAAAASSNPNITSSDNFVFSSSYKSVDWFGELIMQRFQSDNTLSAQQWSAMQLLDCATTSWTANTSYTTGQSYKQGGACYVVKSDYVSGASFAGGTGLDGTNTRTLTGTPVTRQIYTVGASGLVNFTWDTLTAAQKAYFQRPYISYVSAADGLSQFCSSGGTCLNDTTQGNAEGQALVDFLRGDRTNEGTYFRARKHVLGDIVSAEARYVKVPNFKYTDSGYEAYKTAKASRAAIVYVAANDGMLHAFDAETGKENWAFVPAAILPEMYRLADIDYTNKHRFFVDGTPEVGDICPTAPSTTCTAAQWKTILVGGLNDGGKAFYALDITDPAAPAFLWEFDNSASKANGQLGYSYTNPRITKLADGTWAVIVASGYNNTDGVARLFVINAATGALIRTIATTAGTAASPAGLAKIEGRASNPSTNNTVELLYGGDLLGNVWRFDVNDTIGASGYEAHQLVQLKDDSSNGQPITAKPITASAGSTTAMVIIGTGRYLGLSDLTDTSQMSMYAIKDKKDAVTLTSPRLGGSLFVHQTVNDTTCPDGTPVTICSPGQTVRTVTTEQVDWGVKNGWYADFYIAGERSVTDATLALGTLVFTTIKPQSSTSGTVIGCTGTDTSVNALSFLYYLDYLTGGAVEGTNGVIGEQLCVCIATRPSVVKQGGTVKGVIRMSGGGGNAVGGTTSGGGGDNNPDNTDMGITVTQDLPYTGSGSNPRRVSWRELNGE